MSKKQQQSKNQPRPKIQTETVADLPPEVSDSKTLFFEHPWLPLLVLAGAAMVAYGASVSNDFVFFDDDKAILYNKTLENPSLSKFFSGQNLGMFAPMTWIFYWIGKGISGEAAWGHHLIALILHVFNAVLAYLLLRRLTARYFAAFGAALIFAVHPVQAEAVCWAAGLSTVLFTTFYLGSLLSWLPYATTRNRAAYVLSLALFTAACWSKSAAVTLPAILVVMDLYKGRNWKQPAFWLEKLPFFALSAYFTWLTFLTRAQEGHNIAASSATYSGLDRFFMVSQTVLFYPIKMLLPFSFSVAYPFVKTNGAWDWTYYAAPVAILAIAFGLWRYFRHKPDYLLGIALYVLPLSAMLPYRTVGSFELRSDRYVYLSCLGLFFFGVLFLEKYKTITRSTVVGILAAVLAVLAAMQTQVWNNGVNLFKNCVDKTPESSLCQCNLAYNSLITNDFETSVRHYSEALQYDPNTVEAYNGRGQAYLYLKRYPEALGDFEKALASGIETPKLYMNQGKCLVTLKRYEEAIPALTKSLELEPKSAETWLLRGKAQQQTGKTDLALKDYDKSLELEPGIIEARMNRAVILFNAGEYARAIEDNTLILDSAPEPAKVPVLLNRANCYLKSGATDKALADVNNALEINPNYTKGYQTRAAIWQLMGQTDKMQADLAKIKTQ